MLNSVTEEQTNDGNFQILRFPFLCVQNRNICPIGDEFVFNFTMTVFVCDQQSLILFVFVFVFCLCLCLLGFTLQNDYVCLARSH